MLSLEGQKEPFSFIYLVFLLPEKVLKHNQIFSFSMLNGEGKYEGRFHPKCSSKIFTFELVQSIGRLS